MIIFVGNLRWILLAVLAMAAQAAPASLNLRWHELAGVIEQRHVIINLSNGSEMKAVVSSVQPDLLILQNGDPIARHDISALRVVQQRKRGRILGTALGTLAGLVIGAGVAIAGSAPVGVVIMAAGPVAGYYIGKSKDRQEIRITIVPD